jgi:UDP-glucose 4-epimerase
MALRYFNAAGADPDGSLGEMHHPETHLIPRVIEAAITPGSRVEVFGTDHPTPDGTAIRDYIHVADLARAHVLAIDHLRSGGESQALNLGTGTGSSVREVVRTVERVSGRKVRELLMPRREGDPPALVADASMATAVLGWQPRLSRIDEIVATAWGWHAGAGERSMHRKDLAG